MLNDCGKKLQKIAPAVFIIGMIASVALAIVLGKTPKGEYNVPIYFSILGGGGLYAYVSMLLVNGFGRIVEYNEEQLYALKPKSMKSSSEESED